MEPEGKQFSSSIQGACSSPQIGRLGISMRHVSNQLTPTTGGVCCRVNFKSIRIILLVLLANTFVVAKETQAVRGFVNVEPHELRVEALIEVGGFAQAWGLSDTGLDVDGQEEAISHAVVSLRGGLNLEKPALRNEKGDLKARFIRFDAEKGFVDDDRELIPLEEALIGMTLAFGISEVTELELDWSFFGPQQERVAVEVSSNGPTSGRWVKPDSPRVSWESSGVVGATLEMPVPSVSVIAQKPALWLRVPSLAVIGIVIGAMLRFGLKTPSWLPCLLVLGAGGLILAVKVRSERVVPPAGEELEDVVYGLLRNVYRAFEFRDESVIYDELDKSVDGDLLEEIYLEIRGSLELENEGGPRVRVSEVALRDILEEEKGQGGIHRATAEWVTVGEVTHWGHTHERTNKYKARFGLYPVGGEWKIGELKLLSEEREQKVSRRNATSR